MLVNKSSVNSLRPPSANVSPLKFALHRSQAAANKQAKTRTPESPETMIDSPPRQSMVRKGMRNIFAPPSPMSSKHAESAMVRLSTINITNETVNMSQSSKPTILCQNIEPAPKVNEATDVPFDLKAVVVNTEAAEAGYSPNKTLHLGLPAAPPQNRISPRRPGPRLQRSLYLLSLMLFYQKSKAPIALPPNSPLSATLKIQYSSIRWPRISTNIATRLTLLANTRLWIRAPRGLLL